MRGLIAYGVACAAAALVPLAAPARAEAPALAFPGFPAAFEGEPLASLPLSAAERAFEEGFPGRVGRFSQGRREVIVRWVDRPTRKLHPSAECLRATGWQVDEPRLEARSDGLWSRARATRDGERLSLREQVRDERGGSWSDLSSWYWSGLLGQSSGPYWAITVAEPE